MHVTLVGLGNIGSHAAEFLARNPFVTALTLIDHDVYEPGNAAGQAIRSSDIGKAKVSVQAGRLQEIRAGIRIEGICDRVENLPLGRLKCDVLAAAVDTRITRQYLNEACWSLGIRWVDSGVNADSGLASVSVFDPAIENACIECNWTDRHYATLEVGYPCGPDRPAAHTNAPASLGGLAGALLAIECGKLISREKARPMAGHQLVYDALWHKHHVIKLRRNPRCRFSHHTLPVDSASTVAASTLLSDIFDRTALNTAGLTVACSRGFARNAICPECGESHSDQWKLSQRLTCSRCRRPLKANGFEAVYELKQAQLPKHVLQESLSELGLRTGDILVLRNTEAEECIEIGEARG